MWAHAIKDYKQIKNRFTSTQYKFIISIYSIAFSIIFLHRKNNSNKVTYCFFLPMSLNRHKNFWLKESLKNWSWKKGRWPTRSTAQVDMVLHFLLNRDGQSTTRGPKPARWAVLFSPQSSSFKTSYRMCHGIRLTKQDYYFGVNCDYFWIEHRFYRQLRQYWKLAQA